MEVRPEPVRLDMSQEITPPSDMKIESPSESKTELSAAESKTEAQPKVKTEPRADDLSRMRSDSKTESGKRVKGTIGQLTTLRSQSMSSIGEKYRPQINAANNNNNTNTNSNNTVQTITAGNISITVGGNTNINSSAYVPNTTPYVFRPGEEW
jgi:hypothetical protein